MNGLNQQRAFNQAASPGLIPCVWMEAGVVDYKLCDRAYDCEHCPFDEALHTRSNQASKDHITTQELINVQGCEVARSLFYHPGHTWARIEESGVVRVGLDDFGQRMLGPAYSVSLPAANTSVQHGSECWRLTHQSGVTALAAPVSGKVKEINPNLRLRPALVNRDPYGEGWTILIEPTDLKTSLKRLMYGERVGAWLQQEIDKLRLLINKIFSGEPTTTNTMTDGGLLTREFMTGLTVAQRRQVIGSFFPFSLNEDAERNHAIKFPNGR